MIQSSLHFICYFSVFTRYSIIFSLIGEDFKEVDYAVEFHIFYNYSVDLDNFILSCLYF